MDSSYAFSEVSTISVSLVFVCLNRVYSCLDPPSKEVCAEYVIEALKKNAFINKSDIAKKKAYLKMDVFGKVGWI